MLLSVLSFELNGVGFDLLDLLMSLLAAGVESLGVLTLQLNRFLIQLLATLQGFLLKLLAAGGELLLQLRQLALHLLLQRRPLLSRFLEQLLTLLTRLFTHLIHLPFRFLADRGVVHQLFALTLGLLNNLFGVPAGGVDELVPAIKQLDGPLQLLWQFIADGIQQLNGIGFVDQSSAGERQPTALQHNFFQLIELIENGEPDVVHLSWRGKPN